MSNLYSEKCHFSGKSIGDQPSFSYFFPVLANHKQNQRTTNKKTMARTIRARQVHNSFTLFEARWQQTEKNLKTFWTWAQQRSSRFRQSLPRAKLSQMQKLMFKTLPPRQIKRQRCRFRWVPWMMTARCTVHVLDVLCIGTRVWPQAYSTDWLRTQEVALESNEENKGSPVATGADLIEWCQQVVVTAAQRAMEIDAQHVGVGRAYQKAPDLGISSTASELSIKAQPLIEKAKRAKDTMADKWKVSTTAQIAVNSVLFSSGVLTHNPPPLPTRTQYRALTSVIKSHQTPPQQQLRPRTPSKKAFLKCLPEWMMDIHLKFHKKFTLMPHLRAGKALWQVLWAIPMMFHGPGAFHCRKLDRIRMISYAHVHCNTGIP